MEDSSFGFPAWLRLTHFANFILITLLVRSGIQILADHPRLYWKIACKPGTEWLKLTRRKIPEGELYTSMDDAVDVSPWLALPGGRHSLGIGRHWHFLCVILWILNGTTYVTLLFATSNWQRLLPTSWQIVPDAFDTFTRYASFQLPPPGAFHPYDPLQQLAYAAVVFVLAPLAILTGAAMSPAVAAGFPWFHRLFINRQVARSLHFLVMAAFVCFLVVHVTLVVLTGFSTNMNHIVFGAVSGESNEAALIGIVAIASVILLNVLITIYSRCAPRVVQTLTGLITDGAMRRLFGHLRSRQSYSNAEITEYFWVNGRPPIANEEYKALVEQNFAGYELAVAGLVEQPLNLSVTDLMALPKQTQTTMHNCIQGWSGIAEWSGIRLSEIMLRCKPMTNARYVIFHTFDYDKDGREYYTSLTIEEAVFPQTILAYEMNSMPLPLAHGAPLRLRAETKLGFKMAKFVRSIEFVASYKSIGLGFGGYREDTQFYGTVANI
jgi:DMSO/TMAO reductase YedYZ molybdopterin-dependent catalytic subunit/thiosulfate reductase cytochrome b subunit